MTTVVYSNGILAADKKSIKRGKTSDCEHCAKKTQVFRTNASKIILGTGFKFNDETVIAIGHAGNRADALALKKLIRLNFDLAKAFQAYYLLNGGSSLNASLLIVTKNAVYVVNVGSEENIKITTFSRNDDVAIGSGAKVAGYVLNYQNVTALNAIAETSTVDKSTGGGIDYVNCNEIKPKFIKSTTLKDHLLDKEK